MKELYQFYVQLTLADGFFCADMYLDSLRLASSGSAAKGENRRRLSMSPPESGPHFAVVIRFTPVMLRIP